MMALAEVESTLSSLLDAVCASLAGAVESGDAEALGVGGYLWKFPSEGSNRTRNASRGCQGAVEVDFEGGALPPPAPQTRDYPRKCDQCGMCWVSDRENEIFHLHECSQRQDDNEQENPQPEAGKLGIPRRMWCEIDQSLTCLQWRSEREHRSVCGNASVVNAIDFASIARVSELAEPANSFQIQTTDGRALVFQWRADGSDTGVDAEGSNLNSTAANNCAPSQQLALDAHQWCEYLHEFSEYAQNSQRVASLNETHRQDANKVVSVDDGEDDATNAAVLQEFMQLLIAEQKIAEVNGKQSDGASLRSHLHVLFGNSGQRSRCRALRDEKGNSVLLLALKLSTGEVTIAAISTLLSLDADCNLQNYEGESPLLLVAASGDRTAMRLLLASPEIEVDQACALGATAFHAAANAGDAEMLQLLCNAGACSEMRDENGWTALHYAAASPVGPEALHFLCELLPDGAIDTQCTEGNTALHVASGCGLRANVLALLQTAANPHVCNTSGESAYHLALRNNHISCAVAINDYQSVHLPGADEVSMNADKDHVVSEPVSVHDIHEWKSGQSDPSGEGAWVEGFTEDGHPYYFNIATGESSWYHPAQVHQQQNEAWQLRREYEEEGQDNTIDNSFLDSTYQTNMLSVDDLSVLAVGDGSESGHHLPLCMIPMVSPLTSLDDPTAAAKYDSARRKAREQRRRRKGKQW